MEAVVDIVINVQCANLCRKERGTVSSRSQRLVTIGREVLVLVVVVCEGGRASKRVGGPYDDGRPRSEQVTYKLLYDRWLKG